MVGIKFHSSENSRPVAFLRTCALVGLVLSTAADPVTAAPVRTPVGSFLIYQVSSVNSLVNEVNSSSVVRSRYSKIYGIPPKSIAAYFKNNLRIMTLSKPYSGTDYFVSKYGKLVVGRKSLKPGVKVFALADGRPVLQWSCGNPLSTVLPKPAQTSSNLYSGKRGKRAQADVPQLNKGHLHQHGNGLNESGNQTDTPVELVSPYTSFYTNPTIAGPTNIDVNIVSSFPSIPVTSLLPSIPLFYAALDHGSGGGGQGNNIPVAPEVKPITAWLFGGLMLACFSAFNRRKKLTKVKSSEK